MQQVSEDLRITYFSMVTLTPVTTLVTPTRSIWLPHQPSLPIYLVGSATEVLITIVQTSVFSCCSPKPWLRLSFQKNIPNTPIVHAKLR